MPVESIQDKSLRIKPGDGLLQFVGKNVGKKVDAGAAPPGIVRCSKKRDSAGRDNINDKILLELVDIGWLREYLKEQRDAALEKVYLHELLQDAEVILPTPKITPRNPELEARIQRLTAEQNAREYQAMTKNVDARRKGLPEDTVSYQMKQINRQLIAVAQFIFSVLAGFAFGFLGVELIVGNLDFGFRLLLGIICALIIALAEIYFLAIKLNEDVFDTAVPPSSTSKKPHQE